MLRERSLSLASFDLLCESLGLHLVSTDKDAMAGVKIIKEKAAVTGITKRPFVRK